MNNRDEFNMYIPGLFDREGGFNDNVGGTGEYVNRGISRDSYPNEDIRGMTDARARDIYFNDFWSQMPSEVPAGSARGIYFDAMVHSGAGGARDSFGGNYDPAAMMEARRGWLDRLSDKQKYAQFKTGWGNRMNSLEKDIFGGLVPGGSSSMMAGAPPAEQQMGAPGAADPRKAAMMQAYQQQRQQQQNNDAWGGFQRSMQNMAQSTAGNDTSLKQMVAGLGNI